LGSEVAVAEKKRRNWLGFGSIAFIAYIFTASTPIGSEIVLKPVWLRRPTVGEPIEKKARDGLIPYRSSSAVGYFDADGEFSFIKRRGERTFISNRYWADFGGVPEKLDLFGSDGELRFSVAASGYPFFADGAAADGAAAGSIFIVGTEQNSVAALDDSGKEVWRRDFPAPITCGDAAAGLALFGMLDGSIELLDAAGNRVFAFEPGGSRLPVIVAAKLSPDGRTIALISGLDPQRFVLLSRSGQTYKVGHHEYLDRGFRRPVQLAFAAGDRYVVFERENGLAVHDAEARKTALLDIGGRIVAFEDERIDDRFFLIADYGTRRELVGIKVPQEVFMRAPFGHSETFVSRRGNRLYLGGGGSVAALEIAEK
jgi:hypothetical protein